MATQINRQSDRRRAFRIYEQVDLCYQKLDTLSELQNVDIHEPLQEAHPHTTNGLPESHAECNTTRNVNISSSGVSFTCQEALQPGDYLMLRILLLSDKTAITSCCKVVYCIPSNPYEPDRFPHTVGVQFVNLRPEDKNLLEQHIQQKRTFQTIKWVIFSLLLLFLIYEPGLFIEELIGLSEILYEFILEAAYYLDEFVNYLFSALLEAMGLSKSATQITGFYLQNTLYLAVAAYLLIKVIPNKIKSLFYRLERYIYRKKSSLGFFWSQAGWLKKTFIVSLCLLLLFIVGMVLF